LSDIALRAADEDDVRAFWAWRNDESARAASFSPEPVPFEQHERWYRERLADPHTLLYVVVGPDAQPVGYVRFALAGGEAEISIALDASTRGRGYGTAAIDRGCEALVRGGLADRIVARVKLGNEISRRAFLRAGFVERVRSDDALELVRIA
jgi:RimJ/RimL family protein N-acetyltransferase